MTRRRDNEHETTAPATDAGSQDDVTAEDGTQDTGQIVKWPSGSKQRVLADLARYVENPDLPMVPHGIAGQLASTANMNVSPSKMFADNGQKLAVVQYVARRGVMATFPRDAGEVFQALEDFFTFCGMYHVPPTLGLFAVYNGVTVQRVNQIERDKEDPRSDSISVCKEAIRAFLEQSAMDGSLNPIIYFHQNKVYFGAIENQSVTLRLEDNSRELSPEERAERAAILMEQGEDGVWRES